MNVNRNYQFLTEKDKPPVANAGGNVSLVLPHNSITLNGNGSYDDRGIISYHWWFDDPSFTIDMKVCFRNNTLRLVIACFTKNWLFMLTVLPSDSLQFIYI